MYYTWLIPAGLPSGGDFFLRQKGARNVPCLPAGANGPDGQVINIAKEPFIQP
jgi:hypothetical protein